MIKLPDPFASNYIELFHIFDRQNIALRTNKAAHDDFVLKSSNWIQNAIIQSANGLPISAKPPLPQELIVNDDGTEHFQPFTDLKVPEIPPQNIARTPTGAGLFGSTPVPDRIDQLTGMLRVLNDKLDQLLKIVTK